MLAGADFAMGPMITNWMPCGLGAGLPVHYHGAPFAPVLMPALTSCAISVTLGKIIRRTGDVVMSGKGDEFKGRVKEAAGALTDDKKLKREGKIDQAAGKTKQAAEKAVDKVKRAVRDD
jgi:uncharacterized protein YjbJ (UPF0337 family)